MVQIIDMDMSILIHCMKFYIHLKRKDINTSQEKNCSLKNWTVMLVIKKISINFNYFWRKGIYWYWMYHIIFIGFRKG